MEQVRSNLHTSNANGMQANHNLLHIRLTVAQYFSSLERLRLAHDGSSIANLRSQSLRRRSSCLNARAQIRSRSCGSVHQASRSLSIITLPKARTRLRKPSTQAPTSPPTFISPWEFAALPPAIRRKHFSPEEQYTIAAQLNPIILDAADEALYKQYQRYPGRNIFQSNTSSEYAIVPDWDPEDILLAREDREEDEDMDVQEIGRLSWLDNDHDLDLRLDDYHAISSDLNSKQSPTPRRRSFRRGLSFSNVSFRRRSSSSISLQSPVQVGSSTPKGIPPPPSVPLQPTHRSHDSTASLDPSATHYQDPAAKMKLRVYLASPQKFDEALEFGFPSLHQEALHPSNRPRTSPGAVTSQPKTFFSDDTPSLSEDESRDERSDYLHQDSPRTPIEMSFPGGRPSQKSSTDRSSNWRPRVVRDTTDSHTYASAADREMTLRMTLTRPELRAIEDADHHMKPSEINERPLERAPLTTPVHDTGLIWDELPEEPSRVKRFFKKLKGRS